MRMTIFELDETIGSILNKIYGGEEWQYGE